MTQRIIIGTKPDYQVVGTNRIGDFYWHNEPVEYPKYYFWPHSLQKGGLVNCEVKCLNDPEILGQVIESVAKIQTDKIITIGGADSFDWCECEKCKSELPSETLIRFVNTVAGKFPDKKFATLAYTRTEIPPTVKPLPNVQVILTTIEIPKSEPYQTSNRADVVEWRKRLQGWLSLTPNIVVWDYYSNFRHLLMPYPTLLSIAPNLAWFRSLGINDFIIQTNAGIGHEFSEVKAELIATEGDLTTILKKRYGIKYCFVWLYIQLLAYYQKSGKWLICYADPSEFRGSFLSDKALAEYKWLLNRKGLEEVYLQVLYAKLELGIATPQDKQRFIQICEKIGDVTVNENHLSWRDFVKTK